MELNTTGPVSAATTTAAPTMNPTGPPAAAPMAPPLPMPMVSYVEVLPSSAAQPTVETAAATKRTMACLIMALLLCLSARALLHADIEAHMPVNSVMDQGNERGKYDEL
ncbi:MAG: hypothetical protein F4181_09245 [Proteobacteria bacterium]|nr:hypothetical protein [Pseudomonadota bacterium]